MKIAYVLLACLMATTLFAKKVRRLTPSDGEVEQWASKVLTFSSQYNTRGWSASQVVGKPDVYPKYGDQKGTWAQKTLDDKQFIELEFGEAVYISKVEIYETYHAGGVKRIRAKKPSGGWSTLWETSTVSSLKYKRIFSPSFTRTDFLSKTIRIEVDCSKSKSWVEIDAVNLIGSKSKIQTGTSKRCKRIAEEWVSSVISFSSQFDTKKWPAAGVVGKPTVYPNYGDKAGTWAQKTKDANQFIEVDFAKKMYIQKIEIYETYHAGGVKRILAKKACGNWYTVWETSAVSDIKSARIFSPTFKKLPFASQVLKIEVDCSKSRSYVEIDAIKVTGRLA